MPLTLKIKKPSQQHAEPPMPARRGSKRRAAPVPTTQQDDDEEYEAKEPTRPSKRARTTDSVEEEIVDVDGDGDGEAKTVEDETRFLSDSDDVSFPLTMSHAASSTSVKSTGKRAAGVTASSIAPASKRSKRVQVVWSDDEADDTRRDLEYVEETAITRADEGDDYAGSDDDFAPSPKRSMSKGKTTKAPAKGKARSSKDREKESRPVTVKDERKAAAPVSKAREAVRGTPATPSVQGQSTDGPGTPQEAPGAGPSTSTATPADLFKDEPPPPATTTPLPSFKRKLPTMKKNKPPAGTSASSTPTQTSAAKPRPRPPSESAPKEQKPPDDGLPILKKTAQNAGKVEVDLSNKDVYASLFKAAGPSVPRSGVAQKEKEERRKELDRLRDADRARRQAEAEHVFDLRAQHDKIASFEERLRARKSGAVYPNILGCAFRHEKEKEARRHQRVLAEQDREKGELLEDE